MLDHDAVERIRDALAPGPIPEAGLRHEAGAPRLFVLWLPDEVALYAVAGDLVRLRAGPGADRTVEAAAVPPLGITTGQMDRRLGRARERLAELVARHEQALAVRGRGVVEMALFRIGPVMGEPVLSRPPGLLPLQLRQQR